MGKKLSTEKLQKTFQLEENQVTPNETIQNMKQ